MRVSELETLYRSQFDDEAQAHFLSVPKFLLYLNEAIEEACIRANLVFDKTSAFCSVSVTSGKSVYNLDDSIYALPYVSLVDSAGASTRLTATDRIELDRVSNDWREQTGTPTHYLHYDTTLELYPQPDAAFTLKLETYRIPDELVSTGQAPEMNRTHHRHLVDWVLYRAYSIQDADMFNPIKATYYEKQFTDYFGNRPKATSRRKEYSNRPHRNKAYF